VAWHWKRNVRSSASDQLIGHKEDMAGNVMVRSVVPQDLIGQQEAQGCEGGSDFTPVSAADRPAAGT